MLRSSQQSSCDKLNPTVVTSAAHASFSGSATLSLDSSLSYWVVSVLYLPIFSLLTDTTLIKILHNKMGTTRECVHLVTRVHFRSHYEDAINTIRSAVPENSMLHANITALCLIERELLSIEVLHCGNMNS